MGIIKVKGNSQISIQPDSVSVNIDLKTKIHEKLEDANNSALQTIIKVKEVCKSKNIDSKEIKIIGFTHNNIYRTVEKEVSVPWSKEKQKTKEQVFVGYQSTANLRFGFDFSMKEIAEMFELLSNIENITYKMVYDVKDKSQYIKECKKLAVKDGLETAKLLAEAANTTVKDIVEISYENNSYRHNTSYETLAIRKCSMADAIEDLGVSDIFFSEEVYITVNIE